MEFIWMYNPYETETVKNEFTVEIMEYKEPNIYQIRLQVSLDGQEIRITWTVR